jgi:hypothetical protein
MSKEKWSLNDDSVSTVTFHKRLSGWPLLNNGWWRTTSLSSLMPSIGTTTLHFWVCACTVCKNVSTSKSSKHVLVIYTKLRRAGGVSSLWEGKGIWNKTFNIAMANLCENGRSIPHQTEEGEPKVEENKRGVNGRANDRDSVRLDFEKLDCIVF